MNVVLGCNGSGKSNLYYAIRAFLDDQIYTGAKRGSLFSEGLDMTQAKAFVQLLFDNSDQSIPIRSLTPEFCRQFQSKKDLFMLNGRPIGRDQFFWYLNLGSFTMGHPFMYVCPSTYDEIIFMNDRQRMQSFKTALGLETKRMNHNLLRSKLTVIQERLQTAVQARESIRQKRQELLDQNQDFDDQMRWLRRRDLILTALHRKTSAKTIEKLQAHQRKGQKLMDEMNEIFIQIEQLNARIRFLNEDRKTKETGLEAARNLTKMNQDLLDNKQPTLTKLKSEETKLHSKRELLANQIVLLAKERDQLDSEEQRLVEEIASNEKEQQRLKATTDEFAGMFPRFSAQRKAQGREEDDDDRQQQLESFEKRRFDSEEEKRKHLNGLQSELDRLKEHIEKLKQEKIELVNEMNAEQLVYETKEGGLAKSRQRLSKDNDNNPMVVYCKVKCEYERLRKEQIVQQSVEARERREMDQLEEQRNALQSKLIRRFHSSLIEGTTQLNQVLQQFKESDQEWKQELVGRHFGTVADNLESLDEQFYLPVSCVLGKRLFSHMVQDKETARKLADQFNRLKLKGVLNFVPLDDLKPKKMFTKPPKAKCLRLLDQLTFNERFRPAMEFLMGNVFLVSGKPDDEEQIDFAGGDFKFVSLDGTLRTSESQIYGGYQNLNQSQLSLYFDFCNLDMELEIKRKSWSIVDSGVRQKELDLAKMMDELQQLKKIKNDEADQIKMLHSEINSHKARYQQLQAWFTETDEKLAQLVDELDKIYREIQFHEKAESEASGSQSSGDVPAFSCSQSEEAYKSFVESKQHLLHVMESNSIAKTRLNKYVVRRKEEIDQSIAELKEERELALTKMYNHQECIQELNEEIAKILEDYRDASMSVSEMEQSMLASEEEQNAIDLEIKALEAQAKDMETQWETNQRTLQALGEHFNQMKSMETLLDNDDVDEYCEKSVTQLNKELKRVERKIEGANNMSLQQKQMVIGFRRKIEVFDLQLRNATYLETSFNKFRPEVDRFQRKRQIFIQQCLDKLAKVFPQVFRQLVPSGSAVLITGNAAVQDSQESSSSSQAISSQNTSEKEILTSQDDGETRETFKEIGIRVNFDGDHQIPNNLFGLSGGQRTILALTYIIAVHQVAPSPFYLLDEIDAALNSQNRFLVTGK